MARGFFTVLCWVNGLLYFTAIATWLTLPDNLTLNLSGSAASIFLSLILLFQKRQMLLNYLKSTQYKASSQRALNVGLVACCLALANYLAYKNPVVFDLSEARVNTLSSQSQKVVQALDANIQITLFERPADRPKWLPLLELYRQYNPAFKWQLIDPDLRPDLVKSKQLAQATGLYFEREKRNALATAPEEAQLTTSMLKMMRPKVPVIGFLQGHGEKDPFGVGAQAISEIKNKIEASAYEFQTLDIAVSGEIAAKMTTLVIWGPQSSLFAQELAAIEKFVKRGGHLIVALDPQFQADPHQGLRALLEKWGIKVANDLVLDQVGHVAGGQASVPLIKRFAKDHPVTRDMATQVYFPLTASVEKSGQNSQNVMVLAQTHSFPAAWAERGMKEIQKGQMSFHPDLDKKGPIGVMAVNELEQRQKVAVFGNSNFLTDQYLNYGGNSTLFLNLLEWMVGEEKFISDGPTIQSWQPLLLGETEIGFLFYVSVVLVPLLMAIMAIVRYRRSVSA